MKSVRSEIELLQQTAKKWELLSVQWKNQIWIGNELIAHDLQLLAEFLQKQIQLSTDWLSALKIVCTSEAAASIHKFRRVRKEKSAEIAHA